MKRLAALLLLAATPVLAAPPAPIVAWRYTVVAGDTLAAVARRMGVPVEALADANDLPATASLRTGQVLRRPDPAGAPKAVKRPAPAVRPAPSPRPAPEPPVSHRREVGAPRLSWPTSGALVSRFGKMVKGLPNNGIDLAAFAGMTVHTAAPGTVLFAGTEPERFGQLIVIDHGGGWVTAYAYLGKVSVKEGQKLPARAIIARIGASGEAVKPTLHFELRRDNVPRDPLPYLPVRL